MSSPNKAINNDRVMILWRLSAEMKHKEDPLGAVSHSARTQRGHSAGTAPIITLFIPGTPLKTTHLQKDA